MSELAKMILIVDSYNKKMDEIRRECNEGNFD